MLGLSEDLNLGPLNPLSVNLQTIKLDLILCFHIKFLFTLLLQRCVLKLLIL
jgi:hypothetical protein